LLALEYLALQWGVPQAQELLGAVVLAVWLALRAEQPVFPAAEQQ